MITSRKDCDWTRCGRTDKGVSAIGQVVALNVRSNVAEGEGVVYVPEKYQSQKEENPFLKMLNSVLPDEIRVVAWAYVPMTFNARFVK